MLPDLARHTEKLLYFYEMMQERSIQGTSRKLRISAATLSYTLKELEEAIGAKLFDRSKKGLIPTEAGVRLGQFCHRLYRELEEVQLQITDAAHPLKRRIRLGTFSSIAIYFWLLLQEELRTEDSLSVSITTKRSSEILKSLMNREVDLAITVGTLKHPQVIYTELYHDSYAFFAKTVARAHQDTLLYIPDAEDDSGKSLRSHIHQMGLKFRDEYELDSFDVITAFIKKGYGIGVLPLKVAMNAGKGIEQVKMPGIGKKTFGDHCFYLTYRRDLEILESDVRLIKEAAAKAVKKLR